MLVNPFSQTVAQEFLKENVNLVLAVEIDFPSGVTRAHSGTGTIIINGYVYMGVGNLGGVGVVREQNTTSPSQVELTLNGLDTTLLAQTMNENCVGRQASIYIGCMDDDFELVSIDLLSRGKLRSSAINAGASSAISVTISNIFEEWSQSKPWRYSDECQQAMNDGDRLFRYINQMADRSIFWGSEKDAPPFRYIP